MANRRLTDGPWNWMPRPWRLMNSGGTVVLNPEDLPSQPTMTADMRCLAASREMVDILERVADDPKSDADLRADARSILGRIR